MVAVSSHAEPAKATTLVFRRVWLHFFRWHLNGKGPLDTVREHLVVVPAIVVSRGLTVNPWTSFFVHYLHCSADGAQFNMSDVFSS